jgi:Tol biopolymer transport system component
VAAWVVSPASAGTTQRVSVSSTGEQGNNISRVASVSGDGRHVAFLSAASNLVPGDTNGTWDVFVRDRLTGTTERVSVSSAGQQANGPSNWDVMARPAISSDGRYVAFQSLATNLVPADTNGQWDIFVRDRLARTTERVNVSSSGQQANNYSDWPSISADGRFVAFSSNANNLVPGDTNGYADIFVRDRLTGTTERVSISSAGEQANLGVYCPTFSADGTVIGFHSEASNLVPDDTNGNGDAFVRDRLTGVTERVSINSAGEQGTGWSGNLSLSADGRFVAFRSDARNLGPLDFNGTWDVFVRDRVAGTTEMVSVASDGLQGNGASRYSCISGDGALVVFYSDATDLVPSDSNACTDIFLHDRVTGKTQRISVSTIGEQENGASLYPWMSQDGMFAVFQSDATNLVEGDTNGVTDVFVRDIYGTPPPPPGRSLTAQSTAGVPGNTARVPIAVDDSDGVAGVQFDLVYDPAILTNPSAEKGALIAADPNWTLASQVVTPGRIRVIAHNSQALPLGPGSGTIAECTCSVSPSATRGQTSTLDIRDTILGDKDGNAIPVAGVDGFFTVIAVHHFAFDEILSPQHGDAATPLPFTITVRAMDQNNNLATLYNEFAHLTDLTGTLDLDLTTVQPDMTGAFSAGVFTGQIVIRQATAPNYDRITAVDWLDPSATGVSSNFIVIGEANPNGDEEINVGDVVMAVNLALDPTQGTAAERAAADVNGDGEVNVLDVIIIQNMALGDPPGGQSQGMAALQAAPSARAAGPVVAAGKPPAPGAKKIAVPVLIDRAQGVAGFNFDLAYDGSVLSPVEVRAGALIANKPDWLLNANLAKNPLKVLAFSNQSKALSGGSGSLVEVIFAQTGKLASTSLRLGTTVVSDSAGKRLTRTLTLGKSRSIK